MAAEVGNRLVHVPQVQDEIPFIDKHFAKVAFAISILVLFILQPFSLFLGVISGLLLHYAFEPNPVVSGVDKIITVTHVAFAMVAAMAALIRLTPSGAMGGYLFQSLPYLFSIGIGSAAFSGYKYLTEPSQ